MEPATTTDTSTQRLRTRRLALAGGLVLLVGGLAFWLATRGRESTDDARVDGRVHTLSAQVGGRVVSVAAKENQTVAAGDLLAEIEPRDYELALAAARANLAEARAAEHAASAGTDVSRAASDSRLASARSAEAAARARLAAAEARERAAQADAERAAKDRERLSPLVDKKEISRQEFDLADTAARAAIAAREAAAAGVDEARRDLESARSDVASAATAPSAQKADRARLAASTARVEQAQAAVERAEIELARTRITAPVAGVIGRRGVEIGDSVAPGQPLFALVATDELWVTANFKESQLARMKPGQPVAIAIDAYSGRKLRGHVDSIGPATGSTFSLLPAENATGNFVKVVQRVPVKIVFDEPADADHPLRPGLSVVPTVDVR
jgi:membrane fusion protein (multidrug efflux system)